RSSVSLSTLAVFEIEPVAPLGTANVAVTLTTRLARGVPRSHGNPPAQGPVADTNVSPVGVGSSSTALVALDGPLLVTPSVYAICWPAMTEAGPVFTTARSALAIGVTTTLELLLAGFGSG